MRSVITISHKRNSSTEDAGGSQASVPVTREQDVPIEARKALGNVGCRCFDLLVKLIRKYQDAKDPKKTSDGFIALSMEPAAVLELYKSLSPTNATGTLPRKFRSMESCPALRRRSRMLSDGFKEICERDWPGVDNVSIDPRLYAYAKVRDGDGFALELQIIFNYDIEPTEDSDTSDTKAYSATSEIKETIWLDDYDLSQAKGFESNLEPSSTLLGADVVSIELSSRIPWTARASRSLAVHTKRALSRSPSRNSSRAGVSS